MIKKIFYWSIGMGLLLNFAGDVSIYHQSQVEKNTGVWVNESYERLQEIDSVKILILKSQLNHKIAPDLKVR